jgi:dTDP-4-dehydrorhamnose 3,5-epimerase
MLEITPLAPFNDVLLIKNKVFGDARGFFLESFNQKNFQALTGLDVQFVQDNHSRSGKGVLRGIHYQLPPHAQGKLVRVVRGAVFDVAVDLRKSSPTLGQWAGIELRDADGLMLWIPPGFGHAFVVLEDNTDFLYKTTDYYAPQCEAALAWNDPQVNIAWPADALQSLKLSEKDKAGSAFTDARLFD